MLSFTGMVVEMEWLHDKVGIILCLCECVFSERYFPCFYVSNETPEKNDAKYHVPQVTQGQCSACHCSLYRERLRNPAGGSGEGRMNIKPT